MNPNNQKPFTQNDISPQFSFFSKVQNNLNLNPNYNNLHSPINRVSILKTEEEKKIVRTNYYGENGSSPGNNEQFCVVTEAIQRKSNIPFDSKRNTLNPNHIRFSFNRPISDFSFNQNIHINNENKKKTKEEYKNLIKRIASQLNAKIKPPTQGFFFFAMQKGQYPLMLIKKIKKKILNHNIELNSDIFEIYYKQYLKYRELVKKIAFLLKKSMKNKNFLQNGKFFQNNQINNNINANKNIQVNILKKRNNDIQGQQIKNNKPDSSNITFNKNNINQNNVQNNNIMMNIQKSKIEENKDIKNKNINYNDDRIKSYNITNKRDIIFQNSNQPFTASHKISNVINPFREAKKQNISFINLTKKNDFIIKNNPFIAQNQNLNNNKKEIKDDIEMIDESRKHFNIIEDVNNNNMINIQNNNNEIISDPSNSLINNSTNINYSATNNNQNMTSEIKDNTNNQIININANKSKKGNIKIVLSTMEKSKEKKILIEKNNNNEPKIDISLNSIIIPKDNIYITNEHKSFINNFNEFMSNNSIYLEYNVPESKEEKGQAILIRDEFWQKYISLIYINYLINPENKLSLFSFMYLIEQYFILCENADTNTITQFKEKIIEIINKMHDKNSINKFLKLNRLNTLDELFDKYDYYIKNGNNKKQEVEIKIDKNNLECNCDICINEKACVKKMSELNRQLTTKENAENLIINAEYPKKNKDMKKENKQNYELKSNNNIFCDSKIIHSFEISYQFIPSKIASNKKNKLVSSNSKSVKKENNEKKNQLNELQNSKEKEKEREIFFDLTNNRKIDEYFKSEKDIEKSVSEDKNRKKSSHKKSSHKKSTHKKISKKNIKDENMESEEEKSEKEKKKNKKKSPKKKITYPKEDYSSDSEYEENKKKKTNISKKYQKKKGKKH